jgi:ABC-type transport system substrate-binding protein
VIHSLGALGEVQRLAADRVRVVLEQADPALPFTLARAAHAIRPTHAPDAGIGTGLYRVRHFSAGQQLLADRVPAHWKDGHAGWFDTVELVSIPSAPVRVQAVAEYLVDGADVADAGALRGFDDIAVWDGQAVARSVAMPAALGRGLFDDLRAPQRWWGA